MLAVTPIVPLGAVSSRPARTTNTEGVGGEYAWVKSINSPRLAVMLIPARMRSNSSAIRSGIMVSQSLSIHRHSRPARRHNSSPNSRSRPSISPRFADEVEGVVVAAGGDHHRVFRPAGHQQTAPSTSAVPPATQPPAWRVLQFSKMTVWPGEALLGHHLATRALPFPSASSSRAVRGLPPLPTRQSPRRRHPLSDPPAPAHRSGISTGRSAPPDPRHGSAAELARSAEMPPPP